MKSPKLIIMIASIAISFALISCEQASDSKSETIEPTGNLYMDIHKNVDNLTAEGITNAHKQDLETQEKYGVKYLEYWYDEESGTVFCLVDAPSKEAAEKVHLEAHGLAADEIIEVTHGH